MSFGGWFGMVDLVLGRLCGEVLRVYNLFIGF